MFLSTELLLEPGDLVIVRFAIPGTRHEVAGPTGASCVLVANRWSGIGVEFGKLPAHRSADSSHGTRSPSREMRARFFAAMAGFGVERASLLPHDQQHFSNGPALRELLSLARLRQRKPRADRNDQVSVRGALRKVAQAATHWDA